MLKRTLLFILALSMMLSACAPSGIDKKEADKPFSSEQKEEALSAKVNALSEAELPKAISDDDYDTERDILMKNMPDKDFADALSSFNTRTATKLVSDGKNNCYSPLSLYFALAIASSGAEGETEKEMLELLGTEDREYLAEQTGKLFRYIYRDKENYSLLLANSVWVNEGLSIEKNFLKNAAKRFYSSIYSLNFADKAAASKAIGDWIMEKTRGLLGNDYESSEDCVISIINALYYKDAWRNEFMENFNVEQDFNNYDNTTTKAEFMKKSDMQNVYFGEGWKRAALLLNNSRMYFVLPDEGMDIAELVKDEKMLEEMLHGGEERHCCVNWEVPKFEVGGSYALVDMLKELGVNRAFDSFSAEFGRMSKESQLFISAITQKTKLRLDEKGVEGAAYTEIAIAEGAMIEPEQPEEIDMKLDRPFLFAVEAEGTIIFIGTVCSFE